MRQAVLDPAEEAGDDVPLALAEGARRGEYDARLDLESDPHGTEGRPGRIDDCEEAAPLGEHNPQGALSDDHVMLTKGHGSGSGVGRRGGRRST